MFETLLRKFIKHRCQTSHDLSLSKICVHETKLKGNNCAHNRHTFIQTVFIYYRDAQRKNLMLTTQEKHLYLMRSK